MSIASLIMNQEPLPEHLSKETLQPPLVTQNLWRWNLHETDKQTDNMWSYLVSQPFTQDKTFSVVRH